MTLSGVKELFLERWRQLQQNNAWDGCVKHVEKLWKEYSMKDNLQEQLSERISINLDDSDESESEDECMCECELDPEYMAERMEVEDCINEK